MQDVTQLLSALRQGDLHAAGRLLPPVHDELRTLDAQRMAREQPGQTLQPTTLVHEAYPRLVGQRDPDYENRGQCHALLMRPRRFVSPDCFCPATLPTCECISRTRLNRPGSPR